MSVANTAVFKLIDSGQSFTVVPEAGMAEITDPVAMAVWTYLLSKPTAWIIRRAEVMRRWGIGKDRYYAAMRHLRGCGLISETVVRNDDGSFNSRELVCKDMPLKPRRKDSRIRLNPPDSGKPGVRQTSILSNTGENLSNTGELVTSVTNMGGPCSLEETITQATSRYANRQRAYAKDTRLTKKSAIALWNLEVAEHYPDCGGMGLSKTITFVLARNTKNMNLPAGLWQEVLKYSVVNWERLRVTAFKWMTRDPMPNAPSFIFWQHMFKFFCEAYYNHREDRDDVQVMDKLGLLDKAPKAHTREMAQLREENARLREEHAHASSVAIAATRQARMDAEKLRVENKALRRANRPAVDIDAEIATWESRDDG